VLKSLKGTVDVGDPRNWWLDAHDQLAARVLPFLLEHAAEVCSLPPLHKDPYGRILIAQAIIGNLEMITLDREIRRYASASFRVVS
jgi:PIN domain nuclease of toxin-antitoxin system